MKKEAILDDWISKIQDLDLGNIDWGNIFSREGAQDIWGNIQDWAARNDDVSRYTQLPEPPPRPELTHGYNPFTRQTVRYGAR